MHSKTSYISTPVELRLKSGSVLICRWVRRLALSGLVGLVLPFLGAGSDAGVEYFEKKIRPILADHCYQCHSKTAEKIKGGLRLDTRELLLKGGDSGPAIVPGDPGKSLLIKAVGYTDDSLQMPPKNKKLSEDQIAALKEWVQMGAPHPVDRTVDLAAPESGHSNPSRDHWAFKPVRRPVPPEVKMTRWVREPIDAFILARLEAKELAPSPPADRRTLIRRLSFDLTGLPPSMDDVKQFLNDDGPDAYSKLVEKLLASPRYGERWGRYWLDVARYADTKGYVFEEERRYPYAYTYRDYVIRAFNEDLPYNQFLIQQIAADQLPLGEDKRSLAALGYLTLGRRFLNNKHDIIDDRIDVVTRGMMALTVSCARCHDHKYDPITAKDYYSLFGVFASSSEPEEKPLLGSADMPEKYSEYLQEHQLRAKELESFKNSKEAEIRSQLRRSAGDYLLAAHDVQALPDQSKTEQLARARKLDPGTVQRWVQKLESWRKEPGHAVFGPWFALSDCEDADIAAQGPKILEELFNSTNHCINPLVAHTVGCSPPRTLRELAQRYNSLFVEVESRTDSDGATDDPTLDPIRQILYGAESPTAVPQNEITKLFDVPSIQKLRALKRKVEELDATHPGAPPRAMALQDNPTPHNPHVLIRGNPGNVGPEVPRQFVGVLAGEKPKPFQRGSGRLELAEAIASKDNPLTARVMVNRVWLHYFGAGLVRTPSDFGLRSEPPSHPELLDYLAARFMDEGWSMKQLHRSLVLSSTYQQSSEGNPLAARVDPGNQLLWKMNRRRLDFEATRDGLMAVSGQLNFATGGHAVDIVAEPSPLRRTVYGFVERQNLPGLFRTFDFASPDSTSPQRFSTTVPQQALFMINSSFVVQQARELSRRVAAKPSAGTEDRVRSLFELVYQRAPDPEEMALGTRFVTSHGQAEAFEPEPPAWQYGFGAYDPESKHVRDFQRLFHFTGDAWQGGAKLPDARVGWVQLKAGGGHPGNDGEHAAIRRWLAPRDLTVSIAGALGHDAESGDGVRGHLVSSRLGELGHWSAKKHKEQTTLSRVEVKAGDFLDFVVDCGSSPDSDSFTWAPVLKVIDPGADAGNGLTIEWNARQDFAGPKDPPPRLDAWDRYAQVLLMSNEFVFLD